MNVIYASAHNPYDKRERKNIFSLIRCFISFVLLVVQGLVNAIMFKTLKKGICNQNVAKDYRFMKKTKILTVLGVLLAMGITACGGSSSEPAPASSEEPASQTPSVAPSSQDKSSSQQKTSELPPEPPAPQKDQTGHIWGADADVAGDAENGIAAYKRAECTENDKAVKYTVNQSVVTYEKGGRKSGTPDGYTKLNANGDIMSFKINTTKYLKGKMYLFGCMDAWSSNSGKKAFSYNGSPNIEVKVNGEALNIAALSNVVYTDFLSGSGSDYSDDGYGCLGDIVLVPGVNYVSYKRLASMNTLVKDFVFVGEELDSEWGEAQTVAGETGYVGYKKYQSLLKDNVTKIEITATDGTFAEGSSNKNGTEEGYLKLNSNGNSISWKFKYDKAAIGSISNLGFMDSFSSNHDVLYSWTSTSGTHSPTEEGNFRVTINDHIIDKSAYMNIRAEDLTKDGDATVFEESKNYSPLTVLPIGNLVLKNGDNVISYSRLGSYNYAFSKFIIIVENAETDYVVETELSSDDNAHFHKVTGTNVVFDKAGHAWVSDEDLASTDTESTCSVKGIKHEKCSVCGKTRARELDLLAHTWVSDPDLASTDTESTCTTHGIAHMKCSVCGAKEAQELPLGAHTWVDGTAVTNSDSKSVIPMECSACHKVGAKMSENDYSSSEFSSGDNAADALRPKQGVAIVYKIIVSKAGNYSLEFGMFCKSNDTVAMSQRGFSVKVNGEAATVTLDGTTTPKALGMTSSNAVQIELCASIPLVEGENTIAITCASYRLHYKGNLVVAEL